MVGPVKGKCSFCPRTASRIVSDDGGFYECCASCERAWKADPSFLSERLPLQALSSDKGEER